jgi:transcriptional regulator with XRE-family HTH domain
MWPVAAGTIPGSMPQPLRAQRHPHTRLLFGRRLRALRKLRGLTQEELGERSNVSGKLVGQIERGEGNPTLQVIADFATALSVEPAALLQFEEERPVGAPERAAGALAAREQVAQYLARRPADDVERALRILEAALGQPSPSKS